MRQIPTVLKRMLIALTVALILSQTAGPSYSSGSDASVPVAVADSISLSVEEADSLIDLIDDQELRIRLLSIDLREAHRLAYVDSVLFEDRLRIYKQQRESWFERIYTHPALWFILGAYAGLQVVR